MMRSASALIAVVGLTVPVLSAAGQLVRAGQPEEPFLPRYLTPAEREYLRHHPLDPTRDVTAPPTGPVRCAAEYEPMDGIIVSWKAFNTQLAQLGKEITNAGQANLYVQLQSGSQLASASSTLQNNGVNMARVKFTVPPNGLDSVWVRDYGPRYVYQGECRAVIDHTYNRPRPNDDVSPAAFAAWRGHAFYQLDLIHGGGNYHLDAVGNSFCTKLISNENPTKNDPQIIQIWKDYQNVATTIYPAFPQNIDSTQHIDMWMQVAADDTVFISDWPLDSGSTQDKICDDAAVNLAGRGYTVHRLPALRVSNVHYTFTNMVMCNDVVIVPSYTNATVLPYNDPAYQAIKAALPAKTVVAQNGQGIVGSAGVFHCIVMHVPRHQGANGTSPTAYLVNLNGGEVLYPGDQVDVRWVSDDDEKVMLVDLDLSLDGGQSWQSIVTNLQPTGTYLWTVPDVDTTQARVRVTARDQPNNSGSDSSDGDFTITSDCYADCDGSGTLDIDDFICFQTNFGLGSEEADCDQSGGLDIDDFICFQTSFGIGCP